MRRRGPATPPPPSRVREAAAPDRSLNSPEASPRPAAPAAARAPSRAPLSIPARLGRKKGKMAGRGPAAPRPGFTSRRLPAPQAVERTHCFHPLPGRPTPFASRLSQAPVPPQFCPKLFRSGKSELPSGPASDARRAPRAAFADRRQSRRAAGDCRPGLGVARESRGLVPVERLELSRGVAPADFESAASTVPPHRLPPAG